MSKGDLKAHPSHSNTLSPIRPHLLQTKPCILIVGTIFFQTTTATKSNLSCPYILKCVAFRWSLVDLPAAIPVKKTVSVSLSCRCYQLPIASQPAGLNCARRILVYNCLTVSMNHTFLVVFHHLWFYSISLFCSDPLALGGRWWYLGFI